MEPAYDTILDGNIGNIEFFYTSTSTGILKQSFICEANVYVFVRATASERTEPSGKEGEALHWNYGIL